MTDGSDLPTGADGGPEATGQPAVDDALARLRDVDDRPVADHVEVYDDVQQRLAAAMDDAPDRRPAADG